MKQIRRNTFETNSSSTHAMCITTCDLYKRWCDGDKSVTLCYYNSTYTLVELKDIDKYYDLSGVKERYENYIIKTGSPTSFEDYVSLTVFKYTCEDFDNAFKEHCEWFEQTITTPNGDHVIAFGYFGYDG